MATEVFLVDYENVQPDVLPALAVENSLVIAFVGPHQDKLPFTFVEAMQKFGNKGQYIRVAHVNKNNLDMHLAFHLGRLITELPDAFFHIISKDHDYDPLLEHINQTVNRAARWESLSDAIARKRPPNVNKANEKIYKSLKNKDKNTNKNTNLNLNKTKSSNKKVQQDLFDVDDDIPYFEDTQSLDDAPDFNNVPDSDDDLDFDDFLGYHSNGVVTAAKSDYLKAAQLKLDQLILTNKSGLPTTYQALLNWIKVSVFSKKIDDVQVAEVVEQLKNTDVLRLEGKKIIWRCKQN
jgi:hypothetical protein